ncbi:MAG: tRNA (N(6)-L-threonylcarbamoyladenosine(37)-C(2))-methylthiotransferase MtaB [Bacteroidetes bacterium]|nr:MAG: tRNA (N(6)-L-threonylcarbamoyladenosine(37)-C(2))-methylthiotransferase MtaB [Bacteroidota bacterium]REJ99904.1 MAG: tRNA (N(6)-L-threonylcarbamoyladenosine(37)-C(2))-methylthiotransferase MtaB [Bacteroidota bacterium]REK34277.1 MAG: tRNA (N(6)-L-threonylcarbamoyladenosine(37)-C(2))-methylthiotransferase MtaB [Bacteroidota bacterium]REK50607.1 MAG: tRNA (N(6)-L-threonylcarbamoyladenosine(37)-C(2))-methylthiotransferase MtaB [Bacteroidota bacterium]
MSAIPTVSFHTLGCKLNFAETSTIARTLVSNGFRKVDFNIGADFVVINTCSVTENADRECRSIVRKALSYNPESFVAVIGCYAQLKPEEIASIEGVDVVLGANEKFNIQQFLNRGKKVRAEVHSCNIDDVENFIGSYSIGDRTRTFLKIQDGCDYTCSYCTIPLARGMSRSDSMENVIRIAKEIAASGVKEIVLTGVNTGDYGNVEGKPAGNGSFLDLIRELDEVEGIERFRISSIEPNLLSDEIIEFVASSNKFVPHFHIPLQSGDDKILGLMRRRYRSGLYVQRIAKIRELMPDACIGADVITGFPGEDDESFKKTYSFLNGLDVSYLHVFTYSERENTHAAEMKDVVPVSVRKERNRMLRILSEKKLNAFYRSQQGKTLPVLFEADSKSGMMHGFSANYVKVSHPYNAQLINQILPVKLGEFSDEGHSLYGMISEEILSETF